jgi:RNA polymerase primary sigma factor
MKMSPKNDTSHWIDQREIANYLQDVRKHEPMSRMEETELLKKIKSGDERAKEKLIYSNLRYVITVAKQYQNQGLGIDDLISEGNLGLLKAAERFNYDQTEVRFLSYAVWWIKQSIIQSLHDNSRMIRLPINVINDMRKANKEMQKNFSEANEKSVLDGFAHLPSVERLDDRYDEEGLSLYDIIEDASSPRPDNVYDNDRSNLNSALGLVLKQLTDTEKMVITRYFGLDGDECTLQEISEDLGLTKERVRQIKEKAIKKLRFHSGGIFKLL